MIEELGLHHPLLSRYEAAAQKTFSQNAYRFSEEYIGKKLDEANLYPEQRDGILAFMTFARTDRRILEAMWLFYYLQFCTDECFLFDLWDGGLDSVPSPAVCEEKFPGYFRETVYLLASDHLANFLTKNGFSSEYLTGYYEKMRVFADDNLQSHGTYGFCRLAPFMYVYAYPAIVRIGRLIYQVHKPEEGIALYRDEEGRHRLFATDAFSYNAAGLRDETADFRPVYRKEGEFLTAHPFLPNGRLSPRPERVELRTLTPLLGEGDYLVYLHIPPLGRLTPEAVDASIEEAKRILPSFFRGFPLRGIACATWLLDPALREVLPEGSNILEFQDRFNLACCQDNHNRSLRDHIFRVPIETPLSELRPKNSFQEKMLARAIRGEKMYWTFGLLKGDHDFGKSE